MGHILGGAQAAPGVLNRAGGHGLHPKSGDGLIDFTDLHYILDDQFSFTAGVTGVDDGNKLFFACQGEYVLQSSGRLLDWLQFKFLRDGGKNVEVPGQVFSVRAGRHFQFNQMPHRRSNSRLIVLKILGIP